MKAWTERRSQNDNVRPNDHREPYQRDKARILHSAAFRRLQAKTQIMGVGQDDFYRTRLTHSLEVAQIGTGLLAQLKQSEQVIANATLQGILPPDALVEAICLAHDIGHPPFGHGGEIALNYMMFDAGGFEANGQTLRIVSKLEPYTEHHGMDLTRRTVLGLIKYPQFISNNAEFKNNNDKSIPFLNTSLWKPTKGLFRADQDVVNWVFSLFNDDDKHLFCTAINSSNTNEAPYQQSKTIYKSFDSSLMEIADDIAYAVHDLEDAIVLENVQKHQWETDVLSELKIIENPWAKKHAEQLTIMLFSDTPSKRKNAIGALVNHLITSIEIKQVSEDFNDPLLKYNVALNEMSKPILQLLKRFVFNNVIQTPEIQQAEFKGQQMLVKLFLAFLSDPQRLLPSATLARFEQLNSQTEQRREICDYLANMSDSQAIRLYNTMFASS